MNTRQDSFRRALGCSPTNHHLENLQYRYRRIFGRRLALLDAELASYPLLIRSEWRSLRSRQHHKAASGLRGHMSGQAGVLFYRGRVSCSRLFIDEGKAVWRARSKTSGNRPHHRDALGKAVAPCECPNRAKISECWRSTPPQPAGWRSVPFGGLHSGSLRAFGDPHGMKVTDRLRQCHGKYVFLAVAMVRIFIQNSQVNRWPDGSCLSSCLSAILEESCLHLRAAKVLKMKKQS